jgi:hypothetical protein
MNNTAQRGWKILSPTCRASPQTFPKDWFHKDSIIAFRHRAPNVLSSPPPSPNFNVAFALLVFLLSCLWERLCQRSKFEYGPPLALVNVDEGAGPTNTRKDLYFLYVCTRLKRNPTLKWGGPGGRGYKSKSGRGPLFPHNRYEPTYATHLSRKPISTANLFW